MYVYIPVVTEDKSSLSLLSPSSTATLGTFGVVGESSNSINLHLLNFFLGLMGDPLGEPAARQDSISVHQWGLWKKRS